MGLQVIGFKILDITVHLLRVILENVMISTEDSKYTFYKSQEHVPGRREIGKSLASGLLGASLIVQSTSSA